MWGKQSHLTVSSVKPWPSLSTPPLTVVSTEHPLELPILSFSPLPLSWLEHLTPIFSLVLLWGCGRVLIWAPEAQGVCVCVCVCVSSSYLGDQTTGLHTPGVPQAAPAPPALSLATEQLAMAPPMSPASLREKGTWSEDGMHSSPATAPCLLPHEAST